MLHPGGGIFVIAEEQDSRGGGFDFRQSFYGEMAHYNVWDYPLGVAVIAELFARKGGTENGNLIAWPDVKNHPIVGDAQLLRPSEFFQPSGLYMKLYMCAFI